MGGSGAATRHAVPEREQHAVPTVPGTDCLATWNAPANRAARQATLPPLGPYPMTDSDRQVSPQGRYEVFVGVSISIGLGNIPPRCMVSFRFPRGYRGELATVYYLQDPTSGRFTDVALARRKNALVEGRVYDQRIDGTLYPAPFRAVKFGQPL
jgi:hypothetical protein